VVRFLFLLYGDEGAEARLPTDELRRIVAEHMAFTSRMREAGRLRSGEQLQSSATATTLDGATGMVIDGPYAETKEQLGGLYVVDCADLDDALAVAKDIPRSPGLKVEIRPLE
jgi:hypothetical protein